MMVGYMQITGLGIILDIFKVYYSDWERKLLHVCRRKSLSTCTCSSWSYALMHYHDEYAHVLCIENF